MAKKVLFLNWKDITHPSAGGAEVFTDALAEHMAKECEVDYFTSTYPGCKQEETVHGYRVIRKGTIYTTILHAWMFWHTSGKKNTYNKIIDQAHGIPFFAAFYSSHPTVTTIIHEVAGELWASIVPIVGRHTGPIIDRIWLLLYRNKKIITVSPSTKKALLDFGIQEHRICIVPNFSPIQHQDIPIKSEHPTLLVLGRIAPVKRIEHAIDAYTLARKNIPSLKLVIIGKTDKTYACYAEYITRKINNDPNITLIKNATEQEKHMWLQTSHLLIMTSKKEGYGIAILEAGVCGTPAIGYCVSGIQDAILDGKTGIIVPEEHPDPLAERIVSLLQKPEMYRMMQKHAFNHASVHTKDDTIYAFSRATS